jgi:hypothetical protein
MMWNLNVADIDDDQGRAAGGSSKYQVVYVKAGI